MSGSQSGNETNHRPPLPLMLHHCSNNGLYLSSIVKDTANLVQFEAFYRVPVMTLDDL